MVDEAPEPTLAVSLTRRVGAAALVLTWDDAQRATELAHLLQTFGGAEPPALVALLPMGASADSALSAGADEVIESPWHPGLLVRRLESLCKQRAAMSAQIELTRQLARLKKPTGLRQMSAVPRRQNAAVSFVNLRSLTETQLNPIVLFESLRSLRLRHTEIVQHWGGTSVSTASDSLVGLFTDRAAALQAARAAKAFATWAGGQAPIGPWPCPPLRIGVHHGVVVVGDLGRSAFPELQVVGEALTGAAQLSGQSAPGGVLISDAVRNQVGSVIELGYARPASGSLGQAWPVPLDIHAQRRRAEHN